MRMSVLSLDDVVALNALIVTAVGLSFALAGRKERGRTFLDLRRSKAKQGEGKVQVIRHQPSYGEDALARLDEREHDHSLPPPRRLHVAGTVSVVGDSVVGDSVEQSTSAKSHQVGLKQAESAPVAVRELNIFFNWNGHTWEAFEVLGVPAGAPREAVVAAFHLSRAKHPDSTPFFQAAADAILKSRR